MTEQYEASKVFFDGILSAFASRIPPENIFLVPGNHDVDRRAVTEDQTFWLDSQRDATRITEAIKTKSLLWTRYMERLGPYKKFLQDCTYDHLLTDPARLCCTIVREIEECTSWSRRSKLCLVMWARWREGQALAGRSLAT